MRKFIARNIGFPIQDFIRKTDIVKTLKFLRESQYWDEQRLEDYRLLKLKKLIEFACRNVPYYENLFKKIKLNSSDINSTSDIEKIPILTKEIARKENTNLISRNFKMKYVKKGKTGGATGPPILVLKDTSNRTFTWASYYRWYEWMGVEYGDRAATFWGSRTVLSNSKKKNLIDLLTAALQNKLDINSFQMSLRDLPEIYEKLKRFQPKIIKGYLSALLKLANYIESNSLMDLKPLVLSSTTETLLPHHRTYLAKIFKAQIFDQYGCGELSAISYECSEHNGLHINQEHIICEVLDNDNKPITKSTGRVIGTDLDNYVMPFIRYENGDLATISSIKCSCGVNQPLMNSIDGRTIDTITLKNGSSVHGVFLTDILYELDIFANKIQRFQAIQASPGQIKLLLESKSIIEKKIIDVLKDKFKLFFSDVIIEQVKEIAHEGNGKFKYIKIIQ